MILLNYSDKEIVSSASVILSGVCSIDRGIVEVNNNENSVYPPQYFEINNYNFKAFVHLSPNANSLKVNIIGNGSINEFGFPIYGGSSKGPQVLESTSLTLQYYPLGDNKPVHLCVILGRDSNGSYDMPRYRTQRGEVANLDTAIRKLKVAGRIMQAFTQEDMRNNGFSNRSFQFVEESTQNKSMFGYNNVTSSPHQEVKVHVLRSPKTVAELRDPNLAQQNSKGTNTGGLFSHALDLIRDTPELYSKRTGANTCIQCAVLYLDATYDVKNDLILTHAALGGGNGDIKLAIFGSHGLHSWPINFPMITPSFLDATHLSKKEVANDCYECGTSWECLNITMGAFMHEIGHLLGCPHQVDGVMLRDYVWWNRSFMTRELECIRTRSRSAVIASNGFWPKVCHWNILDKMRFLFHGSFALPTDPKDSTMGHVYTTTMKNDNSYPHNKVPVLYTTQTGSTVKSDSGIFMIELVSKDLARFHIPYFPKSYGGNGFQHEVFLDYDQLYAELKHSYSQAGPDFDVRILSLGGDLYVNNFKERISKSNNVIRSDFGLGKGSITGYKSDLLGRHENKKEVVIGFDESKLTRIRVYHGGALDGIKFYYSNGDAPAVPPRNYMDKITSKLGNMSLNSNEKSVLIGNEKPHFTEVLVKPGDRISKMHFRNGAWIDAVQFEFESGDKTNMLGNAHGGHLTTLEIPGKGYKLVGMYGYIGGWLDGIGIIYAEK